MYAAIPASVMLKYLCVFRLGISCSCVMLGAPEKLGRPAGNCTINDPHHIRPVQARAGAENGDPTSRGWPTLRRPRQRGPDYAGQDISRGLVAAANQTLSCYTTVILPDDRRGWLGSGLQAGSVTRACTSRSDDCVGSLNGRVRITIGNLSRR